ncbi:MAG: outer membrane protein assembly factor BamD [Longimonas sp.]|uniref:outer membrane protein assembly factor BamD n=1 Tax=Longimonas sp. TaxID=2039626 RepID=UPI00335F14F6
MRYLVIGVALCGLFLAACSGSQRVVHNSAEEAYQKASELFEEGDYETAIQYYRGVFQYGRGTEWAPSAQFMLARAHEERGENLMAATEYNRFTQLYRNHERLPEAEYRRALMYYNESPHYKLDQTDTERALANFRLYMQRHPNDEHVDDAQAKVQELRNKLARKQFEAGELYERRRMYRAAAFTYESVFDQYPDSDYADQALLASIRTYIEYSDRSVPQRQAERLESAIANYERLTQVFPDSPLLGDAERQYERAQSRLERIREREDEQIAQDTP